MFSFYLKPLLLTPLTAAPQIRRWNNVSLKDFQQISTLYSSRIVYYKLHNQVLHKLCRKLLTYIHHDRHSALV